MRLDIQPDKTMVEECPIGWGRQDEFYTLEHCEIPILGVQIFEGALLVILSGLMAAMILMFINYNRKTGDNARRRPNLILLVWNILHIPLTAMRGIFNLLGLYSEHSIWVNLVVNLSSASATGAAIFFMYLEMTIIIKGSLKQGSQTSLVSAKWILAIIAALQATLFAISPIVFRVVTDDPSSLLYFGFWLPSTFAAFVGIAYFSVLGMSIYLKLRRATRSFPLLAKTAKRLLIFLIICFGLGITMGLSGLAAMLLPEMGWHLIRVCWLSAAVFDFLIFYSLTRGSGKTTSKKSTTSANTSVKSNESQDV